MPDYHECNYTYLSMCDYQIYISGRDHCMQAIKHFIIWHRLLPVKSCAVIGC